MILQSLLCLMREENWLSRADIEELCERVAMRAAQAERDPLPCCGETARHAATEMAKIGGFIGAAILAASTAAPDRPHA
ncbi:hypothetical protein AB5I41_13510 [Sphingomonas sp. MMS24-JH45]